MKISACDICGRTEKEIPIKRIAVWNGSRTLSGDDYEKDMVFFDLCVECLLEIYKLNCGKDLFRESSMGYYSILKLKGEK